MPQRVLLAVDFVFRVGGVWFSQWGVGIERSSHGALWFFYSLYIEGRARPHESGRAGCPQPAADATGIPRPKAVREADALAGGAARGSRERAARVRPL